MSATTTPVAETNGAPQASPTAGDVLSLADAAVFLRVPEEAVRQEATAGQLPGRLIAGEWRFSRAGVLAWLATPSAPRPTVTQWLKDNPRVWDEEVEREVEAEIAEMAAHRKSLGTVMIGDPE